MTAVLFDLASGEHIVTIGAERDQVVTGAGVKVIDWWRWHCLCGVSPAARWSHRELAERMATHHLAGKGVL